ncbi:delta-lactam-biosynthetic de-N-acetylase [Lachnotalea glycerini]|uniref:Delta-lactam-biosynthetic de-N-acetylase n=1 Tax=Lachnotalea glycerini TaxID=1763509 RepID=A0A318ETL2_9FIRM|nr:polysaccharide deacetylase family protein [Lachnotalea glycerini]PXV96249.1 delta-lactam-biosynthetic de-N-acetylase [Lachnotalea glycerini]
MKKNKYLIVLLMVALAAGCKGKDSKDTLAQTEITTQDNSTDQTTDTENAQEENQAGAVSNTEEQQSVQTSSTNDDTTSDEAQSNQTTSENQTTEQEEQPIEQISLDGLSTESKGWGQGGNVDDNNVPVGCTMYQNQYGYLGADFVRTDSDAVFLTFDEGYEYPEANSPTGNTAKILDTLKEKNVKAVFFITLPYAKSNPDLVKRMIEEGHVVGNHSVNHPSNGLPSLATVEDQQNELIGVHDYVLENYNYTMDLFRYPTGAFSEQSLAIVHNLGYKSVFWSFAYKDWITDAQPDKTEALKTMKEKLHPGAIYLLHAVSTTNTEVLGDFIDAIKEAGYDIERYE